MLGGWNIEMRAVSSVSRSLDLYEEAAQLQDFKAFDRNLDPQFVQMSDDVESGLSQSPAIGRRHCEKPFLF